MDPSIKSLRAVVTLSQTLHFGRAAEELQVSRSTLGERIVALERQLGEPLFVRTSRTVEATPLGRSLAQRASRVVEEHDNLCGWLNDEDSATESRVVRVGFPDGLSGSLTARVLRDARARLPEWTFTVQPVGLVTAEPLLRCGLIDVALVPGPIEQDSTDLRGSEVWREPRLLMIDAGHPLAGRDAATLDDIRDEPVIMPTAGTHAKARWWAVDPRPDGSTVRYGPPGRDLEEVVQMVAAGVGISITAVSTRDSVSHPGVAFVALTGVESSGIWVLSRAGDPSRGATVLEDAARSVGASLSPES